MATFFFDNDISFRIVHALRELVPPHEHTLLALRDEFPTNVKDVDWIPVAGEKGWIVVSRDHNQRRRTAEFQALVENNVTALYIRQSGNAVQLFDDAARIIRNWPKICNWGVSASPRTLAKLNTKDQIEVLR